MSEPMLTGRFAIYETPDGGYHVSYRPDGTDIDMHVKIPAAIIKMAQTGGKPMEMFKAMLSHG